MTENHEKHFRIALEKILPDGYYTIGDDTPDENGRVFILGTGKGGKIDFEVSRRKLFGSLWSFHTGYKGPGIISKEKLEKIKSKSFDEFTVDDLYNVLQELRQKQ